MKDLYSTPLCRVFEIKASGVICTSGQTPDYVFDDYTPVWND